MRHRHHDRKMAERGYDMIGVDYSEGMLGQAMEKKIEKQLPIQYVCQDMRELELYGTVDAVICTLDSLNHLPSFEDVTTVFQRVWESTETGGVFVFDMNTLYKHRELLGNQVYVYETDAVYCVWETRCARTTAPWRSHWICFSFVQTVAIGGQRSRSLSVLMHRNRCRRHWKPLDFTCWAFIMQIQKNHCIRTANAWWLWRERKHKQWEF